MFRLWKVLSTLSENAITDLLDRIAGISIEKLFFTFELKIVVYNYFILVVISCSCSSNLYWCHVVVAVSCSVLQL